MQEFRTKTLAAKNGISPSTCLERVRRLQRSNTLTAYRAEIAPEKLGVGVQAMISVRLRRHSKVSFSGLKNDLIAIPEVIDVYLVAGSVDIMVHVGVRDVSHLHDLVSEKFTAHENVASIETSLIFEHARAETWPNYLADGHSVSKESDATSSSHNS